MKYKLFLITATFIFVALAAILKVSPPFEQNTIGKALIKLDTLGQTEQKYCKAVVAGKVLYRLCK